MMTENEALKVVMEWMKAGGPPLARRSIKKKSGFQMTACGYLSDFWKAGSPYVLGKQARGATLLACLCGFRLGEVRGLQWEDVDFANSTIRLCHNLPNSERAAEGLKSPKWGSSREVPAPDEVLDALRALTPKSDGFVFTNSRDGGPMFPKAAQKSFESMLRSIGITEEMQKARRIVFHSLRHTFISLSRGAGVPDFVVQRIAGHKTMNMTNRYSHASEEDIKNAKLLIEKMFHEARGQCSR
jgi:integrase